MTNKIPKSRIELQKLKIQVLRKYFVIVVVIAILEFFAVLLYGNQLVQFSILGTCFILLYKTAKILNVILEKETSALYETIERNANDN